MTSRCGRVYPRHAMQIIGLVCFQQDEGGLDVRTYDAMEFMRQARQYSRILELQVPSY